MATGHMSSTGNTPFTQTLPHTEEQFKNQPSIQVFDQDTQLKDTTNPWKGNSIGEGCQLKSKTCPLKNGEKKHINWIRINIPLIEVETQIKLEFILTNDWSNWEWF